LKHKSCNTNARTASRQPIDLSHNKLDTLAVDPIVKLRVRVVVQDFPLGIGDSAPLDFARLHRLQQSLDNPVSHTFCGFFALFVPDVVLIQRRGLDTL
jgi:hypothetical protein